MMDKVAFFKFIRNRYGERHRDKVRKRGKRESYRNRKVKRKMGK